MWSDIFDKICWLCYDVFVTSWLCYDVFVIVRVFLAGVCDSDWLPVFCCRDIDVAVLPWRLQARMLLWPCQFLLGHRVDALHSSRPTRCAC